MTNDFINFAVCSFSAVESQKGRGKNHQIEGKLSTKGGPAGTTGSATERTG